MAGGKPRQCERCGGVLMTGGALGGQCPLCLLELGLDDGDGRFTAGAILADRYRILSLLGRGGMGEVYRAYDLKLSQPVALKFLPEAASRDPRLLEHLRNEVRMARQVSHPNVCRVYDIVDVDGSTCISMEYVDGEDLAALLRRIGRFPGDKAVEIARRLCAGLAAAHAKGVLHRDLKPANIMIDARGQALIMDFGLAAIADEVEGAEVRNGTPAWMAPEQLSGQEVSERSDIYSLGLVLHEIFTGRRRSAAAERNAASDLEPAIGRVIEQCLDSHPARRPESALALARMLPGGDPVAEALAAGHTPSPEMVAASEDTSALSVRMAVACLGLVVAGLIGSILLSGKSSILRVTPFPDSYEILAQKARDIATGLGYTAGPVDQIYRFKYDTDYHIWAERNLPANQYRRQVAEGQPPLIYLAWRESPSYLWPMNPFGDAFQSEDDPAETVPGMVSMRLDPKGRLIRLRAVSPRLDSESPPAQKVAWKMLFDAAGLDPLRWTASVPREIPPFSFDERAAWTGTYAHSPDMPLRIEAASWRGRPVFFEVSGPWWRPLSMQPVTQTTAPSRLVAPSLTVTICFVLVGAMWLARRNFLHGRGDLRGSFRLAASALICYSLAFFVQMHHIPALIELAHVAYAIAIGMFGAGMVWVLYMALEPYLRRRLPQSLISWSRLLAGGGRDPLVAGHILIGTTLGAGGSVLFRLGRCVAWQRGAVLPLTPYTLDTLNSSGLARGLLASPVTVIAFALVAALLFLPFRAMLRHTWLAAAALIPCAAVFVAGTAPTGSPVFAVLYAALFVWVMIRFGVLPGAVMILVAETTSNWPLTADPSAWYADKSLIIIALVLGLTAWSFRNALSGRKVLPDDFL